MSIKVIAMGNILMKDDAIGIEVAKEMQEKLLEKGIEVILGETDVQYSISQIKHNDYIFVLDAACYGQNPGEVTCFQLNSFTSNKKDYLQHSYNFLDLLKIYYPNIHGEIYAIEVNEVGFGLGLSSVLQEKLKLISQEIFIKIEKSIIKNRQRRVKNMHDTILLNKISEAVKETCINNNIKKVNNLTIVVGCGSHVNEENLYEHLQAESKDLIGEWTKIILNKEDIPNQTAILHSIKGEQYD